MFRAILFPVRAAFPQPFSAIFHIDAKSFPHFDPAPDLFMFLLTPLCTTCHLRAVNIPFCLRHAANFHLRILSLADLFFSARHREEKIARNEHGEPILRDARIYLLSRARARSHFIYFNKIHRDRNDTHVCIHEKKNKYYLNYV